MKRNYGLQELVVDERDLQLGGFIKLPELSELPPHFELETLKVKNQKTSDFCAAFSASTLSELQEGVELSPEFLFAKAKELTGDYTSWGLQLRDVMKALQKKGTIEQKDAPFKVGDKPRDFLANPDNWPKELDMKAKVHQKQSYFQITGQYDAFDNARASLWYFRDKKQGIEFGVQFGWPIKQIVLDRLSTSGYGHAMCITGFTTLENGEPALIVQNSYGEEAGFKGKHYITRTVYNYYVTRYGHFMMVDIDPETVYWMQDKDIKLEDNWLIQLWKMVKSLFKV